MSSPVASSTASTTSDIFMEAGDTISIPQSVWHQAVALGKEDAEVVICFNSPDRITEIDDAYR